MDFSKVDQLIERSLVHGIHVIKRNYEEGYFALLVNSETSITDFLPTLREEYGYEHILAQRPWFPYRIGTSSADALQQLLDFVNHVLTADPKQLLKWSVNCLTIELAIARTRDGYCDFDNDWILTYEEAISK